MLIKLKRAEAKAIVSENVHNALAAAVAGGWAHNEQSMADIKLITMATLKQFVAEYGDLSRPSIEVDVINSTELIIDINKEYSDPVECLSSFKYLDD